MKVAIGWVVGYVLMMTNAKAVIIGKLLFKT